jgi:glyoxylase-like metal-dependent hydrolase (beta-lactamase superfamily II)
MPALPQAAGAHYAAVGAGVYAIDTGYVRPRMDASHLIVDAGRAAFVDTGTFYSVTNLLAALTELGLGTTDVDYILLTHIHLDHAGGAGRLAELLPRAKICVHPRGAAHLREPDRLVAATKAVYGERHFDELYGRVVPAPAERIVAALDGQRILLGTRSLEFMHTPGHALHHLCIVDRGAGEAFCGDTFGVSYRELDTAAGAFIFATTTPTQFDPGQLHASVDRILALRPHAVYLTHYSRVGDIERLGAVLHADIDAQAAIAKNASQGPGREAEIAAALYAYLSTRLDAHGYGGGDAERHALLDGDVGLNAAGLDAWLIRSNTSATWSA